MTRSQLIMAAKKKYYGSSNGSNLRGPCRLAVRRTKVRLGRPFLSAVTGDIHGQFEAAPDADFVKCAAQMILDHLFAGANNLADFAVGQTFPDQDRDLNFFRGKALARCHDCAPSFVNTAMASFTRLRPSRIPARKNNVRKCCFTVRGLILSCPAISLLLQPCTSRFSTSWSRGVTFTCSS